MIIWNKLFLLGTAFGCVLGVLACMFLNELALSRPSKAQAIELQDEGSIAIASKPYVVVAGKTQGKLEVILLKDKNEEFSLDADDKGLKFQTTTYEQGRKITLFDTDGDGVPDVKIFFSEDGAMLKTQLNLNGVFQDAHAGSNGWEVNGSPVIFKNHQWQ